MTEGKCRRLRSSAVAVESESFIYDVKYGRLGHTMSSKSVLKMLIFDNDELKVSKHLLN